MALAERILTDLMGDDAEMWNRLLAPRGAANAQTFVPPVDLYETEHEYVVELDAPGLEQENISVELVNGQLVIAGERHPAGDVQRRFRQERWHGRFVRTFQLGQQFRGDDISADYSDGVLTLRLPKPEEVKPKKITIGTADTQKQLAK